MMGGWRNVMRWIFVSDIIHELFKLVTDLAPYGGGIS